MNLPMTWPSGRDKGKLAGGIIALVALLALYVPLAIQEQQTAVISEGDHGRDLYLADQVAHGKKYLRDFSYTYGPLSLEVQGLLFRICGPSLRTALRLRAVMLVLLVVVAYFAYRSFASAFPAAMGALLTGGSQFFFWHTFNHLFVTIGLVGFVGAFGQLLQAGASDANDTIHLSRKATAIYAWLSAFAACVVLLSKLNIGIALLGAAAAFLGATGLIRRLGGDRQQCPAMRPGAMWVVCVGSAIVAALVYGLYGIDARPDAIRASFPYESTIRLNLGNPFTNFVREFSFTPGTRDALDGVDYVLFRPVHAPTMGAVAFLYLCTMTGGDRYRRWRWRLTAGFLAVVALAVGHEWLIRGNIYAIIYFVTPVASAIIAMALDRVACPGASVSSVSVETRHASLRQSIPVVVGIALVVNTLFVAYGRAIRPIHRLDPPRGGAGVLPPDVLREEIVTSPDGKQYVAEYEPFLRNPCAAYNDIMRFIDRETRAGEPVLCLPHAPLYNFLADRAFPTRQIEFLKYSRLSQQNEQEVIDAIKRAPVRLVLISNVFRVGQDGSGDAYFPTTCPLVWQYITANYEPLGTLGDYYARHFWAGNNGVLVLWKKPKTAEDLASCDRIKHALGPLQQE